MRPVRLGRKGRPVRVAEQARVAFVRIGETQLDVLPIRLRLAAGAVRAGAVQRGIRIVIQSRERAPRPPLVLLGVRAASSHLSGQGDAGTQGEDHSGCRHQVRILQCVGAPSAKPPTDEVGLAIGIRHESGDRSMDAVPQDPPVAPATSPLACIMTTADDLCHTFLRCGGCPGAPQTRPLLLMDSASQRATANATTARLRVRADDPASRGQSSPERPGLFPPWGDRWGDDARHGPSSEPGAW